MCGTKPSPRKRLSRTLPWTMFPSLISLNKWTPAWRPVSRVLVSNLALINSQVSHTKASKIPPLLASASTWQAQRPLRRGALSASLMVPTLTIAIKQWTLTARINRTVKSRSARLIMRDLLPLRKEHCSASVKSLVRLSRLWELLSAPNITETFQTE